MDRIQPPLMPRIDQLSSLIFLSYLLFIMLTKGPIYVIVILRWCLFVVRFHWVRVIDRVLAICCKTYSLSVLIVTCCTFR
jgi:hypothetical protein